MRAALLALIVLVGCRTVPIPEPFAIQLPTGMTHQQATVATLAGILNSPPPPEYDPMRELTDEQFNTLVWRNFVGSARSRSWFPEGRDANTIFASVNTRGLYLKAAIDIDPDAIRIRMVESRNLSEEDGMIHKRAVLWLQNLDAHIRREVGRMSVLVVHRVRSHRSSDPQDPIANALLAGR